jgi:hypothetical protein
MKKVPEAVRAAIRAAGPDRHVVLADFALRLARLGHITEVRVGVAGGAEAAEAVRRVLAELAAPEALETASPETALADASGAGRKGDLRRTGAVTKA